MMAADPSALPTTPRINSSMLDANRGKLVRLVGRRLAQRTEDSLLLEASDRGQVEVRINPHEHFPGTEFVEILGQVSPNGHEIIAYTVTDFGNRFDMAAYEKLVQLRLQYPDIF